MNKIILAISIVGLLNNPSSSYAMADKSTHSGSKVYSRGTLEREGRILVKQSQFDAAIEKYRAAIHPDNISHEHEKSTAMGAITDIFRMKGDYDNALKEFQWFLDFNAGKPPAPSAIERREQLLALKQAKDSQDTTPVIDFLSKYKNNHMGELPPNKLETYYVSTILRLYDTIGDYDAGIKYIDEIIDWIMKNEEFANLRHVKSLSDIGNKYDRLAVPRDKDWRAYKVLREFLLVREAFEQDKADGKKGSMKEGKPGRAQLALIRSDYFPW